MDVERSPAEFSGALAGARSRSRPRPVLMIPLRRCGSHALRLRLNFNPDFHSPYPLHVVDFLPLVPLYGDLADDGAYFRLVVDVIGLQAASMVKWPGVVFDPVEVFESIAEEPRSVHRVALELLLRSGEHHGARVVMDKSLDNVHQADELMRLFPDLLFLNVVRDPRAQVASMNRAIIHDFDTTLNALTWVAAHDAGRRLASRHPERVLTIRYEDFLDDQELTLRRVCEFFGVQFLPSMLDVASSGEAQRISKLSDLWASNCFAPILANRDKFKAQLGDEEIRIVESLALDHMRHYGYEVMTSADADRPDGAALASCRVRSAAARERAWDDLARKNPRDYVLRRFRADFIARTRDGLVAAEADAGRSLAVVHSLRVAVDTIVSDPAEVTAAFAPSLPEG